MKNTFIVLTHTDADGHLAGYIATTYTTKDPFTEAKVFYYNYNGIPSDILELSDEEIKDSTFYITDLSICEEIKNLIKHFVISLKKQLLVVILECFGNLFPKIFVLLLVGSVALV